MTGSRSQAVRIRHVHDVVGHPLERARVKSAFLLRSVDPPLSTVEGRTATGVSRIGKRIAVGFEGVAAILVIGMNVYYYFNKETLSEILRNDDNFGAMPAETFIGVNIIAGIILIGLLILFYWVIYGLLLRRLKRNYKELKKIEE